MNRSVPDLLRCATLLATAIAMACTREPAADMPEDALDAAAVETALDAIRPDMIEHHIRVLADDSLAGRAPGTPGFAGAAAYAEATLASMGLEPAGVGGTYRQPVPLRESLVLETASGMSISTASGRWNLDYGTDFYLSPDPLRERVDIGDAPVAFVGYGVSAPGLGYDDYADIDVQGKIVAFLSGAPAAFPSNERAYYSSGATKDAEAIAPRRRRHAQLHLGPEDPRFRWDVNVARAKRGQLRLAGRRRRRRTAATRRSGVAPR